MVRRDRLTFDAPQRDVPDLTASGERDYLRVYEQANDLRLAARQVPVRDGMFAVALAVPRDALGACHVRVFVEAPTAHAFAATDVDILAVDK